VAASYRQRWEIELGFREIKQSMSKPAPIYYLLEDNALAHVKSNGDLKSTRQKKMPVSFTDWH
jgi:hypothetical protein